jgi:hypothetical protein
MFKTLLRASLLLAPAVTAIAATPSADLDELHQRQFRYARAMMQLNQIEGFERGPSIDALLRQEREAKAKRAEQGWRDAGDARAQLMDAFAQAVERVVTEQRAKRTMSRQWRIDEPYPSHWSVSGNETAAADCARAIEHPLGQPLRIEMNRDGVAWLRVVAPGKGYWAFDTLVSEFDTKLSVYRDCRDIGAESKQISDDTVGLGAIVGLDAKTAGQTFLIKLERKGGVGSLAIAKSVLAGSISGRVTRASDGAPVSGVSVRAIPDGGGYSSSGMTSSDGSYGLSIYADGNYFIRVDPVDQESENGMYVPTIYPSAVCASTDNFSTSYCNGLMTSVLGTTESTIEGVDVSVGVGTLIAGVVVDETNGNPLNGVTVSVVAAEDLDELSTRRAVSTDLGGRYRMAGLPPRSWRVQFSRPEYKSERWSDLECPEIVDCAAGTGNPITTETGSVARADAGLHPAAFLTVRVSAGGSPSNSSLASLYRADGEQLASHYSYMDGIIKFGPLLPGGYRVVVAGFGSFSKVLGGQDCPTDCGSELMSGEVITIGDEPVERSLELKPYPSLQGRIIDEHTGAGIPGAQVLLLDSNSDIQLAETDAEGDYRFPAVFPSTRVLHVRATGYQDELHDDIACESLIPLYECPPATQLVFDINSQSKINIDAQLNVSGSISGQVRTLLGDPINGNQVLARISPSGQLQFQHYVAVVNGNYRFIDAPAGDHYWGWGQGYGYFYRQVFPGVNCANNLAGWSHCNVANAQLLTTQVGVEIPGVDFDLQLENTRIVRVVDEDTGAPVVGVALDQWDLNGSWLRSTFTNPNGLGWISRNMASGAELYYSIKLSTDSSGRYIDEVYDNYSCPIGTSAYLGGCSMANAWTVPVLDPAGVSPYPPLEIRLRSADPVFESGFE